MALMLFLAFLSLIGPARADDQEGQRDCANLRSAVLQLVGDWSKELLFTGRDMSTDGWLDANMTNAVFKDVQLAVMYFEHAYEEVPRTREACRALTMQFGMTVGTYIEQVTATGTRPERGIAGR